MYNVNSLVVVECQLGIYNTINICDGPDLFIYGFQNDIKIYESSSIDLVKFLQVN